MGGQLPEFGVLTLTLHLNWFPQVPVYEIRAELRDRDR